jgi:hypothetical protein
MGHRDRNIDINGDIRDRYVPSTDGPAYQVVVFKRFVFLLSDKDDKTRK